MAKAADPLVRFLAMVAAVAFILLIPAIANGAPFIFFDSDQYLTVGRRMFETLLGSGDVPQNTGSHIAGTDAAAAPDAGGGLAAIAGGRSPIYSLVLYGIANYVGLWGVAALQSIICALLIVRFCQLSWGRLNWGIALSVAAALCLLSGLGFYASFIMPDVFAGCLVLTLAIFLYFKPVGRLENALLIAGLLAFATLHTANLLLIASALIAACIVLIVERGLIRSALPRFGVIVGVAVAAFAFNAVYAAGVKIISGDEVRSPPYLIARLIGDGTAETYLATHCSENVEPFAACAFAGVDFYNHDAFLWEPLAGGFSTANPDLRAALTAEEIRFAIAVIGSDPGAQFVASFSNFVRQLSAAGINEINYGVAGLARTPEFVGTDILRLTPGAQECVAAGTCAAPAFGSAWNAIVWVFNLLLLPVFGVTTLWLLARERASLGNMSEIARNSLRVMSFIALLALANAAICGVLSSVNDRYQGRMSWSLALSMIAFMPAIISLRSSRRHDGITDAAA